MYYKSKWKQMRKAHRNLWRALLIDLTQAAFTLYSQTKSDILLLSFNVTYGHINQDPDSHASTTQEILLRDTETCVAVNTFNNRQRFCVFDL